MTVELKRLNGQVVGEGESLKAICEENRANLGVAYLRGANLGGANLGGAYLRGANLEGANLRGANLEGAYLEGANLGGANLAGANLRGAYLEGADLWGANLRGAYLEGAETDKGTRWPAFQISQGCELPVWKKLEGGLVAKLLIPADAGRTATPIGRKCRASQAKVLGIFDEEGNPHSCGNSSHNPEFQYTVGATITPDKYDDDFRVECTFGIHFFITREEAEEYNT